MRIDKSSELEIKAHSDPIKDSMYGFHPNWDELGKVQPAKTIEKQQRLPTFGK